MKLMQEYGYGTNSNVFYFDVTSDNGCVTGPLVYFSRVFVLEDPGRCSQSDLLDKDVMRRAWDFLRKRFELTLASYGVLEEIETVTKRQATALKLKRKECKIFRKAVEYCDAQLKMLEEKQEDSGVPSSSDDNV